MVIHYNNEKVYESDKEDLKKKKGAGYFTAEEVSDGMINIFMRGEYTLRQLLALSEAIDKQISDYVDKNPVAADALKKELEEGMKNLQLMKKSNKGYIN